jgi:4-coumarate--CoA ligase
VPRGPINDLLYYSPNSLTWPIALFGCIAAGLKCTLANSSYTPHELAYQLSDSDAGYVFVHPALLPTLFKAFEELNVPAKEAQKRVSDTSYFYLPCGADDHMLGHLDEL